LISLLACAVLVGSAAYTRAGDTLAQISGNDKPKRAAGAVHDYYDEMHEARI